MGSMNGGHQAREAAVRDRDEGPVAVRYRGALGELEGPDRRVGTHLRNIDDALERPHRAHPRPHARNLETDRLRAMARA